MKIKLNGKKLVPTNSVKYLGITIDKNLNWKDQISNVSIKLNKANAMISKVRHFVDKQTLKSIYFAIFESHLYYSCLVWAQNFLSVKRLYILQKKALRLMYFQKRNTHTSSLFSDSKILKFPDKVSMENCIFISNSIHNVLPSVFQNWFTSSLVQHEYNTRWGEHGFFNIPRHCTKAYGRFSITISALYKWNFLQSQHRDILFKKLKPNALRELLQKFLKSTY